jgi:hypothetical protein
MLYLCFVFQARQAELQKVKSEMSALKRDKSALQAKVAELKGALRASVQHVTVSVTIKLLFVNVSLLFSQQNVPDADGDQAATKRLPFDMDMLDHLLKEPGPVTQRSKCVYLLTFFTLVKPLFLVGL